MRGLMAMLWITLAVALSASAEPPPLRALLIANENYSSVMKDWPDLDGPRNDVRLMREVLEDHFGDDRSTIETMENLTQAQMLEAFERLVEATEPGEIVYIHYSGHGSRVPDANGDEGRRGWDSTLVPVDARAEGSREILDDELAIWLHRLRQKTADVVFVVDACHSGTISRANSPLKVRQAPSRDPRNYAWSTRLLRSLEDARSPARADDRFVQIAACLDEETAKEYRAEDGTIYGLLSWQWARALQEAQPGESYASVMQRVRARVFHEWQDLQNPRLEGARHAPVLGGSAREPRALLAVTEIAGVEVRVDGGLLQGFARGAVVRSWPADAQPTELLIESAGATSAQATLMRGSMPEPGDLFELMGNTPTFDEWSVAVEGDTDAANSLGALLDRDSQLHRASKTELPDVVVQLGHGADGSRATFLRAEGSPLAGGTLTDDARTVTYEDDVRPVVERLRALQRRQGLLDLAEDHTAALAGAGVELVVLEAVRADGDSVVFIEQASSQPYAVRRSLGQLDAKSVRRPAIAGDVITFRIRNHTSRTRHFYLLNLDPSGLVQQAFPPKDWEAGARMQPGEEKYIESAFQLTTPGRLDTYVWLIVSEPTDLRFLESGSPPVRGTRGEAAPKLASYLMSRTGLQTRGQPGAITVDDLAARVVYIDVAPEPEPPSSTFALIVSIEDYPGAEVDLNGPHRDADSFVEMLTDRFHVPEHNILRLRDAEANRATIVREWREHLSRAGSEGAAIFYYSGHGVQLPQRDTVRPENREPDEKDEALLLSDGGILLDDELGALTDELETESMTLVLDCCYAGTASRGAKGQPKRVWLDELSFELRPAEPALHSMAPRVTAPRSHRLLAAAQEDEVAWVMPAGSIEGVESPRSVFTYCLTKSLREAPDGARLEEILGRVRVETREIVREYLGQYQSPRIAGFAGAETVVSLCRPR